MIQKRFNCFGNIKLLKILQMKNKFELEILNIQKNV